MTNNSFYVCEKYYLLIYETKDMSAFSVGARRRDRAIGTMEQEPAATRAEYYSKTLNSRVTFSNPGEPIFVIKKEERYWNVIIGERVGWIVVEDWLGIKELKKE